MGCGSISAKEPKPGKTEKQIQAEVLKLIKQEREPAESERLMEEYSVQVMSAMLDEIKSARELGTSLGDLTDQEMTALNTMESNAIDKLIETVGRGQGELVGAKIADLVSRGVLQGDIGRKILGDIGEESQRLISEGARDIGTSKMASIIGLGESKAERKLSMQQFGVSAGQYAQMLGQQWQSARLGGGTQMAGIMTQERGAQADRALQEAVAREQNKLGIAGLFLQ